MSSSHKDTKIRILEAARFLFEGSNGKLVRISDIAKQTQLSRQAIYLHFASRTGLLIALVRHVDEVHDFKKLVTDIQSCATCQETLHTFIERWAHYLPLIAKISQAMQHHQEIDKDAAKAWQDRMDEFMSLCLHISKKMKDEGALQDIWTVEAAAEFIWSLTSIRTWRELTDLQDWNNEDYINKTHHILKASLLK